MAAESATEVRAYTAEEIKTKFIQYLCGNVDYWSELPGLSERSRVHGAIFSTLVMLDGFTLDLPAFTVSPCPHPSDEAYCKSQGENWYRFDIDISGDLHNRFTSSCNSEK